MWHWSLTWALCSPKEGRVSEIPSLQVGPLRPKIGQGLAGGFSLELWPGLNSLSPQGHTLCSRTWGIPGDPESGAVPSPNPLCSLLTFRDFNTGAIKNKVLPLPSSSLRGPSLDHPWHSPLLTPGPVCEGGVHPAAGTGARSEWGEGNSPGGSVQHPCQVGPHGAPERPAALVLPAWNSAQPVLCGGSGSGRAVQTQR